MQERKPETTYETPGSDILSEISAIEWRMLQEVNAGGPRAECQDSPTTFKAMREGQFSVWSRAAAKSYLNDLHGAIAAGRNLVLEKYVNMMLSGQSCMSAEYLAMASPHDVRVRELAAIAMQYIMAQNEAMYSKFPRLSLHLRPLHASGDDAENTSIETYQQGELYTYSADTLELLISCIRDLAERGKSYAEEVLANSLRYNGFASLDEAEASLANA
ncbi:MAG: DUF4125 family protein [Coriobacteriales bacterium]|jgi:hypothetical protein|nr:DUF4125 family protein [Coriobacteriales bacterium]